MIFNRQRRVRLALRPLEEFLRRVQRMLRLPEDSVSVCLVGESAIGRLNRAYRGKRGATDVLSFANDGKQRTPGRLRRAGHRSGPPVFSSTSPASFTSSTSYLGDIAIAPAVARRNARRFGRRLAEELRILILHGVLHLLGYDHETDRGEMALVERRLRRRLGLERGG